MTDQSCLFCRIVQGEISAEIVHETDELLAFRDIGPQAPTHVLVIPKQHITSLAAVDEVHGELLGRMLLAGGEIARAEGISDAGFRGVINTGADGGQTVHHLHLHVLGGRAMEWPPG